VKTKLNLGAGLQPKTGEEWINLDIVPLPNIDMVYNLVFLPYPFENEQFEFIMGEDILEHLPHFTTDWRPFIPVFMEEMYRILKPNGAMYFRSPSVNAKFAWTDPSHTRTFTKDSMGFFDPDNEFGVASGFISTARFHVKAEETENGNLIFNMVKI
jgi:predicted SAM-dependent methyltransferase